MTETIQITLVVFNDLTELVLITHDNTELEHSQKLLICFGKDNRTKEDILYSHHKRIIRYK